MNAGEDIKELLAECYNNFELFCATLFPQAFFRPFSGLHREIFKVLEDDSLQKVVIAAPRGFGKSTIVNMAYPARNILFQEKRYIIPISATAGSAIEQSENLKNALRANQNVLHLFGDIKPKDDPFSKTDWVTASGIKILPRGAGQQIRGSRKDIYRPDLFIVDDLEDDESVESTEQREKLKKWFFSSVQNSVDRGSKDWRIIVIGTVLHEDSLLSNLLLDPSWYSLRLELCDDQFHSNWPDFMTDQEVRKLYEEYRASGMADAFYREYRNIPIALDDQGFKPEYFRYYEETEEDLNNNPNIITAILCDPAKTMKKGSCFTAISAVSVDTKKNRIYIRDILAEMLNPGQTYDAIFEMADRYNALILAPEVTSLNEYILYPLKTEMNKRNLYYTIIEVKPREGKTGPKRSGGLIPMYRRGEIFHNKNTCGGLEKNLLQWPRPSSWDSIDAVSGILFVMEEGEAYFEPVEQEDPEEDYQLIQYEPPLDYSDFSII